MKETKFFLIHLKNIILKQIEIIFFLSNFHSLINYNE